MKHAIPGCERWFLGKTRFRGAAGKLELTSSPRGPSGGRTAWYTAPCTHSEAAIRNFQHNNQGKGAITARYSPDRKLREQSQESGGALVPLGWNDGQQRASTRPSVQHTSTRTIVGKPACGQSHKWFLGARQCSTSGCDSQAACTQGVTRVWPFLGPPNISVISPPRFCLGF